ncbi:hypothetical protein [Leuconostoc pseudomesenteroides]|uniref:DUF7336 domain-containing protein n=1 Tax=Leuconostoc pseudomesenteroides TaxID=33968 RepID=UPI0039ED4A6A
MDKKCEKGLPGVRGPKMGQTLLDSMTKQIFELQLENKLLRQNKKTKVYLLTQRNIAIEWGVEFKITGIFSSRLLAEKHIIDNIENTEFESHIIEMTLDYAKNDHEYPYVYYKE